MTRRELEALARRVAEHFLDWAYATYREIQHAVWPGHLHRYPQGPLAPVLLLPGVYETWEFLRPVAERLSLHGHPIHAVPGFGYNSGSIPSMAALAQRYLENHDLWEVIIVAHSKGGLIAKQVMVTDDGNSRIGTLIAINTPFAGSRYARFALRRVLREFAPTAETLSALTARRDLNARIVSIYSEDDPVIPGNGELAGATNIRLPLIGHFRLLSSTLLLDTIDRQLGHLRGS